jgi:hypothetical protein
MSDVSADGQNMETFLPITDRFYTPCTTKVAIRHFALLMTYHSLALSNTLTIPAYRKTCFFCMGTREYMEG